MHIHTRLFLWLGPRERVIDSMIMYAYVPWSSFVPCCLPPASPFRMGPPRSVRSLASFLSPDRTAGRVVYLCHSSTQIRLSYLFSPVAFLAMPFQGCNATAAPLGSQGRATCMDWENSPSNFEVETKENARLTPSDVSAHRNLSSPTRFCRPFSFPLSVYSTSSFFLHSQRTRYGPRPPRTRSKTLKKLMKGLYRQFDNPCQYKGLYYPKPSLENPSSSKRRTKPAKTKKVLVSFTDPPPFVSDSPGTDMRATTATTTAGATTKLSLTAVWRGGWSVCCGGGRRPSRAG